MPSTVVSAAAIFAVFTGVSAHGIVTSPTPRALGNAMKAACGQQVYNQMASDPAGNIQGMAQTGGCALQWWWDARSIDQTYMNCVDFTLRGSSSSGGGGGGSSSGSSSADTTSTAVAIPTTFATSTRVVGTSSAAKTIAAIEATAIATPGTDKCDEQTVFVTMTRSSAASDADCTQSVVTVTVSS